MLNSKGTASFPPPPLTAPNVPACVATAPAVTVPAGASQTLAPGCFGALRLNKDSTLTLTPGGIYNFKEVRPLSGSTLLLGLAAFAMQIPFLVLAPLAGVFVDRANLGNARHRILRGGWHAGRASLA